jgi:hypothetical protein
MATGCKQGDNFGSLFYSVGFQRHLILIHESIQRHIEGSADGCSLVGGVTSFIDDTQSISSSRMSRSSMQTPESSSILTSAALSSPPPPGQSSHPMASWIFKLSAPGASFWVFRRYPLLSARSRHDHHQEGLSLSSRCLNPACLDISRTHSALRLRPAGLPGSGVRTCRQTQRLLFLRRSHRCRYYPDLLWHHRGRDSLNGYGRVLRSLPAGAEGLGIPCFAGLAGETLAGEDLRLSRGIPAYPSPKRGDQLDSHRYGSDRRSLNDPITDGSRIQTRTL